MSTVTYGGFTVLYNGAGVETKKVFANDAKVTGLVDAASGKIAKLSGTTATYDSVVAGALVAPSIKAGTGQTEIAFDKLVTGPFAEFTSTLTIPANEDVTVTQNGIPVRGEDGTIIARLLVEEAGEGEDRAKWIFQSKNTTTGTFVEVGRFF